MNKRALRHTKSRGGVRGFTLVELMVTVTILVILLAIGAPQLQSFIAKRSVSTQADIFASALRMTRSEAIKRGIPVTICASTNAGASDRTCSASKNWATGWIVFINKDNDDNFDSTKDELLSVQQAFTSSGGIYLDSDLTLIKFSTNGLPSAFTNRTFTVSPKPASDADHTSPMNQCLTMTTSGRVKIKAANATTGSCS